MVWFTILITNLVLCAGSAWMYFYWQALNTAYVLATTNTTITQTALYTQVNHLIAVDTIAVLINKQQVVAVMYAFYVIAVIAGLILLITIALLRKIKNAVEILKLASKACYRMPTIGKNDS